jgi:hypothetical protein
MAKNLYMDFLLMHDQAKPYKRGNQGINDAAADIVIMLGVKDKASKRSKKKPSKKAK